MCMDRVVVGDCGDDNEDDGSDDDDTDEDYSGNSVSFQNRTSRFYMEGDLNNTCHMMMMMMMLVMIMMMIFTSS